MFWVTYKRKTFWFSNLLAQIDYQSRTHSLHLAHISKNLQLFDSLAFLTDSVQFSHSVVSNSLWPHGLQHARPPVHHQLPELAQTHVHWLGDAIQQSHPLLSPSPPVFIFPSIRVFSSEPVFRIRWPKYWDFSYSISPSNEYLGLISFRIDWFDLLAVQGTLKSQFKLEKKKRVFSNTTVQKHQFFSAQLSLQSNSHIHTWLPEKP